MMTQEEIHRELDEIIRRYCNRENDNDFYIWKDIKKIARHRGIIGKPMQATGFALIARDVLRIWEGGSWYQNQHETA